jgi:Na+-transporting methylmalonyl-CoA/oxaloacetate decarboxylase gamma subunit
MPIDWGFAGRIGGVGFSLVFAVLIILALAIWVVGLVVSKNGKASDKKKGD